MTEQERPERKRKLDEWFALSEHTRAYDIAPSTVPAY